VVGEGAAGDQQRAAFGDGAFEQLRLAHIHEVTERAQQARVNPD